MEMKLSKKILCLLLLCLVMLSFSQCTSAQKLSKKAPMSFGQAYYKSWVAGTREGGAGINLIIPYTNSNNILLDSVYFRGKSVKLVMASNGSAYVGRFKKRDKSTYDVIMSNEPGAEYGNEVPDLPKPFPFKLENDECIVSYKMKGKTKYFRISNIINKKEVNNTGYPLPIRQ